MPRLPVSGMLEQAMQLLYPREMLHQIIDEHRLDLTPDEKATLITLTDTVFFASLMLEEGEPVRVAVVHQEGGASALAHVEDSRPTDWGEDGPPVAWDVTAIAPLAFNPRNLAKLSRGLKYGTHLAVVGGSAGDLRIDGIARRTAHTDGGQVIRIAAPRPGALVFETQDSEFLRFEAGERTTSAIDVLGSDGPIRSAVGAITGKMGGEAGYSPPEWAIVRLLHRMRATGAGALLAMLPDAPKDELLSRIKYRRVDTRTLADRIQTDWSKFMASVSTAIFTMDNKTVDADRVREIIEKRAASDTAREALEAAIEEIAQMSAIDGAVLVGPELNVYGAGYIIPVVPELTPVRSLDVKMHDVEPLPQRYGARHSAAFSFAHDHRGGVAFVVSEDGPVSCATRVNEQVVVWTVYVPET